MNRKIVITTCAVVGVIAWIAFCGYQWSWGPFSTLHDIQIKNKPGNAPEYQPDRTERLAESPLQGMTVVFLGSSVTYGSGSKGISFPEYLAYRHDLKAIKEAVPGTTLVDSGSDSYIARMNKLDIDRVDLFVCQLSTNDATQKKPLGGVGTNYDPASFDTSTVAGALEYIIASTKQRWNCPVVFFTNPKYDSEKYGEMVSLLRKIKDKWNITVIDLWDNESFNDISDEQRELYMADAIHPTQAGYSLWWVPEMEKALMAAEGE